MTDDERASAPADVPVSWRAARPGAEVYGSDGAPAGTLRSVEGDGAADIFHGLVVDVDGRRVLVPADAVATITQERVDVTMSAPDVRALADWSEVGASARPLGEREAPGAEEPPAI